jgi:hypothetical protein
LFGTDAKLGLLPGRKDIDFGAENRMPKRIFGSKREEVVSGWRKLHYEEFNDVYSSLYTIRMIK